MRMHEKVKQKLLEEKEAEKEQAKIEKQKKAEKLKKKLEESKKKKAGDFKEPPMSIIINLLGGLKLEIKRLHFRYEDDYF